MQEHLPAADDQQAPGRERPAPGRWTAAVDQFDRGRRGTKRRRVAGQRIVGPVTERRRVDHDVEGAGFQLFERHEGDAERLGGSPSGRLRAVGERDPGAGRGQTESGGPTGAAGADDDRLAALQIEPAPSERACDPLGIRALRPPPPARGAIPAWQQGVGALGSARQVPHLGGRCKRRRLVRRGHAQAAERQTGPVEEVGEHDLAPEGLEARRIEGDIEGFLAAVAVAGVVEPGRQAVRRRMADDAEQPRCPVEVRQAVVDSQPFDRRLAGRGGERPRGAVDPRRAKTRRHEPGPATCGAHGKGGDVVPVRAEQQLERHELLAGVLCPGHQLVQTRLDPGNLSQAAPQNLQVPRPAMPRHDATPGFDCFQDGPAEIAVRLDVNEVVRLRGGKQRRPPFRIDRCTASFRFASQRVEELAGEAFPQPLDVHVADQIRADLQAVRLLREHAHLVAGRARRLRQRRDQCRSPSDLRRSRAPRDLRRSRAPRDLCRRRVLGDLRRSRGSGFVGCRVQTGRPPSIRKEVFLRSLVPDRAYRDLARVQPLP